MPDSIIAASKQFDGPGQWSPGGLLVGCAADCLMLTFRAVARASKLDGKRLDVDATGTLERVMRFTERQLTATLELPADESPEQAARA